MCLYPGSRLCLVLCSRPSKKELEKKFRDGTLFEDEDFALQQHDIQFQSYQPIHGVIRQLERLRRRPYIAQEGEQSCLKEMHELLHQGKTIIIDKNGLNDEDKMILSTVLASYLYR
jgi:hypothetical protein